MDAHAWTKRVDKNPQEAKALAALAQLPKSKKAGRVEMPIPVGPDSPYDKVIGHKSLHKRIAAAPVEDVPVGKLVSNGQKTVRADQVEHYIGAPGSKGSAHGSEGKHPTDHPIVVKVGGHQCIYDGHHRATAAILRGEKSIKARVVDLDGPAKKP